MLSSRKMALVVAVAVGFALVPSGAAMAAEQATSAYTKKERQAEKRQNRKVNRALRELRQVVDVVTGHRTDILQGKEQGNSNSTRLAFIEAVAPQLVAGLTALRDGLVLAGEGLTALRTLATSTEYGIGQVYIRPAERS